MTGELKALARSITDRQPVPIKVVLLEEGRGGLNDQAWTHCYRYKEVYVFSPRGKCGYRNALSFVAGDRRLFDRTGVTDSEAFVNFERL
jgi:hypothetical protein